MGLSERLFWSAEYSELLTIAANKNAYDGWVSYARQKAADDARR